MIKVKISSFSVDESNIGASSELELKSFIVKTDKDDQTLSENSVKDGYTVIMSESEYKEKLISKSTRRSNPLLVNFEEYSS
jgi:hypothetical protein